MSLIGVPTLIVGLILMLVGPGWFTGAYTVGLILTIVSGVVILFGLLVFLLVALAVVSRR